VTFVEGGVTLPELAVSGYSWGAANPAGTKPSLQDVTLTVAADTVEPGLWGHLAAGTHVDSATIHVTTVGLHPVEYLTDTLTDVFISSFTTSFRDTGSGDRPQDTIQLHFGEVKEEYFPTNPDGTRGSPNTADYNQATGTSGGTDSLAGATRGTPDLGLSFVEGGVSLREIEVSSYSWGAATPAVSTTPGLQDVTLAVAADTVDPGLWGHLASGIHLPSATIHARKPGHLGPIEYATYTLTDVTISSFTTSFRDTGSQSDVPQDTIQLHFGAVKEEYFPIDPVTGSRGSPHTADYNRATGRVLLSPDSLAGPPLSPAPAVGLTFVEGGVTLPELAVSSYSWSAVNPTQTVPNLRDFTLTLDPGVVEPGLWGHLAAGIHLDSATIRVRKPTGSPNSGTAYITYILSDVVISSFTTAKDDGPDAPQDTIQLSFGIVTEFYTPINLDGSQGTPNEADYDRAEGIKGGAGSLAGATPDTPDLGLSFVERGVALREIEVSSYSWGAANPTGAAPGLQDVTLTVAADTVEPGLWGHLASGIHLPSATIHARKPSGMVGPQVEYITYTLTDVTISSFTTSFRDTGSQSDVPQDTIQLHFGAVKEEYFPIDPVTGNRGSPHTADYNRATGRVLLSPNSLRGPTLSAKPLVGLTFVEGGVTLPEMAVSGYSWGAANPAGTAPSLQDFTLTLAPGVVEPGLWGRLVAGIHLDSATIRVSKSVGPHVGTHVVTYIDYTLKDVFISSFTTTNDRALGGLLDTIQLHFGEVKEQFFPVSLTGGLGQPNIADYDLVTGKVRKAGTL
jgi:type VI protein secretion system component Hcp